MVLALMAVVRHFQLPYLNMELSKIHVLFAMVQSADKIAMEFVSVETLALDVNIHTFLFFVLFFALS